MKKFPSSYRPVISKMFMEGRVYAGLTALYLAVGHNEPITERAMWLHWQRYHQHFGNEITLERYTEIVRLILSGADLEKELPEFYAARMFYIALRMEGTIIVVVHDDIAWVKLPKFWEKEEYNFTEGALALGWKIGGVSLNSALAVYVPLDRLTVAHSIHYVHLRTVQGVEFTI